MEHAALVQVAGTVADILHALGYGWDSIEDIGSLVSQHSRIAQRLDRNAVGATSLLRILPRDE